MSHSRYIAERPGNPCHQHGNGTQQHVRGLMAPSHATWMAICHLMHSMRSRQNNRSALFRRNRRTESCPSPLVRGLFTRYDIRYVWHSMTRSVRDDAMRTC